MTYKGFKGVISGEPEEHDPLGGVRGMLDRFCAEDGSDGEMVEMAAQVLIAATEQALVARVGYAADLHRLKGRQPCNQPTTTSTATSVRVRQ